MRYFLTDKVVPTDLAVVFYTQKHGLETGQKKVLPAAIGRIIQVHAKEPDFSGKWQETMLLYTNEKTIPRVLLYGLGDPQKLPKNSFLMMGGAISKILREKKLKNVTFFLPDCDLKKAASGLVQGLALGGYRFQKYKKEETPCVIENVQFITTQKEQVIAVCQGAEKAAAIAEAVNYTRDLVTTPAHDLTPTVFAEEAVKLRKQYRRVMNIQIFTEKKLRKMGMGALLSVGAASPQEAHLIILEYKPKNAVNQKPFALVGKGITFDSGGLNLKSASLDLMKFDMAGAASVLGTLRALAELKVPVWIVGAIPVAENVIGSSATKPGDVIKTYAGKTVEITNTDAEGRLVLCDALAYVQKKYKPYSMIDVATLTGACIISLGADITAMLSNHPGLVADCKKAAEAVTEKVWELPLDPDYIEKLKGDVSDLKNWIPGGEAGTIMGAAYLSYFVGDTPWLHLDIAGTAWAKEGSAYQPKGATGRPVRMLVEFFTQAVAD